MSQALTPTSRTDEFLAPTGANVSFAFVSFGRRIGLSLCDESLPEPVQAVLPVNRTPVDVASAERHFRLAWHTAVESPLLRDGYHLYDGDDFRRWAPDREQAVEAIETEVEHDIAEFADPWLFMHAGVVAWQGEAIVLPGESFAGKSTLIAALVEAGATYFSDEYAVLDANGWVLPFPRRLSLRDGPLGAAGRRDLRHRGPRQNEMTVPLPIGRVVVLTYRKGHDFRTDTLPPGAAILELCQHMTAIRRRPQDVLETLNVITRAAPTLKGVRGEAEDAVSRLLNAI